MCGRAGAEHMRHLTHDVEIAEGIEQTVLVGFRNEVAAFRIHTLFQCVADLRAVAGADDVPESRAIAVGSDTRLGVAGLAGFGLGGQGRGDGRREFTVKSGLTLQPFNLVTERDHVVFHAFVGGVVLSGQDAVLLVSIEESLGVAPELGAAFAHFGNLTHCVFPPKN